MKSINHNKKYWNFLFSHPLKTLGMEIPRRRRESWIRMKSEKIKWKKNEERNWKWQSHCISDYRWFFCQLRTIMIVKRWRGMFNFRLYYPFMSTLHNIIDVSHSSKVLETHMCIWGCVERKFVSMIKHVIYMNEIAVRGYTRNIEEEKNK